VKADREKKKIVIDIPKRGFEIEGNPSKHI